LGKVDSRVSRLYPTAGKGMNAMSSEEYSPSAADYIRAGLLKSFKALKTDKIDIFYLHGPDRKTDFQITTREADKCTKKGSSGGFASANSCHGK
jgi:aflatoxin B1 aldehyde reductase